MGIWKNTKRREKEKFLGSNRIGLGGRDGKWDGKERGE